MRRIAPLASLALLATLIPATTFAAPSMSTWIVTLRGDADPAASARALLRAHGGEVRYIYTDAINGFAFTGPDTAAHAIVRSPLVTRVEADADVWLGGEQLNPTWGLDRIDDRAGLDQSYTYGTTGAGVTAYVIDSGILTSHVDFGGRASLGLDLVGTNGGEDCNGHGTHVAGTIGGSTYGVAKEVRLVAVRVFDCSGGSSWSTIIKAIDWVIGDHDAGELAVANMSLGGGGNSSVDDAVRRMISDGVGTAVAAGNGNFIGREDDACKYSPARVTEAMTISATNDTDTKASWANYGDCVDWFAPGVSITSAWIGSNDATKTISGTSMATPHTAGVAALYLEANATDPPQQVRDAIFANTTKDAVKSSRSANNDLLYSAFIGTGSGGDTTPTTGSLVGVVTASGTSEAIFGAEVSIVGTDTSFSASTTTDGTGSYTISGIPAGTYAATATATGYESANAPVSITAGNETIQDFALTASAAGDGSTFSVSLAPSSTSQGNTWTAIVAITATDSANQPVNGVTVTGAWEASEGTGTTACTTGEMLLDGRVVAGQCQVHLGGIRKRTASVTFSVDSVTDSGTTAWDGVKPPPVTVLKP